MLAASDELWGAGVRSTKATQLADRPEADGRVALPACSLADPQGPAWRGVVLSAVCARGALRGATVVTVVSAGHGTEI